MQQDRTFRIIGTFAIIALCISGMVYPYLYYTQSEVTKQDLLQTRQQLAELQGRANTVLTGIANEAEKGGNVLAVMEKMGVYKRP